MLVLFFIGMKTSLLVEQHVQKFWFFNQASQNAVQQTNNLTMPFVISENIHYFDDI